MRAHTICFSALYLIVAIGCSHPDSLKPSQPGMVVSPSGLGSTDLLVGQGASPTLGQTCVVEVLGWFEESGGQRRIILDTRKRGFPARFPLGVGRVIKGWDEGLATMKKGGKRLLRVPPHLGYSPAEAGTDIPSGATLYFEVELVDIR
jgi:peptidylprolyl isomerase